MTATDKRKTIAAIRKVARWMSDPRHRVRDWTRIAETDRYGNICRLCVVGAFHRIAGLPIMPRIVEEMADSLKPSTRNPFAAPWTTAELRKLFAESIKAVEESE